FAWVVIIGKKKTGKGRTASFFLPDKIVQLIHSGKELGEADDIVFGKTNSKQEMGAIGLLTDNRITRKTLYEPAVIIALVPFVKKDLFV
ncbi:inositol monophosphatase, partial [Candidatus Roizmanbacteria bacterium CG09_land_8_20_14_0_10_41_9]